MEFVDFAPRRLRAGNIFRPPVFEPFENLMEHLNKWLQQNPSKKVVSCETMESYEFWDGSFDPGSSTYSFNPRYRVKVNREIRLPLPWCGRHWLRAWVMTCSESRSNLQEIGYVNITPLSWSFIENDATIGKPSVRIYPPKDGHGQQPSGQILNVDTFACWGKFQGKDVDSLTTDNFPLDKTYHQLKASKADHQIQGIRVFYDKNSPGGPMDLYFCDFSPDCVGFDPSVEALIGGNRLTYEQFGSVFRKLQSWMAETRSNVKMVNIETNHLIMPTFPNNGSFSTMNGLIGAYPLMENISFLRVHFTLDQSEKCGISRPMPKQLVYQTTYPKVTSSSMTSTSYESYTDAIRRDFGRANLRPDSLWGVSTLKAYARSKEMDPERMYTSFWKYRGNLTSFTMLRGARVIHSPE